MGSKITGYPRKTYLLRARSAAAATQQSRVAWDTGKVYRVPRERCGDIMRCGGQQAETREHPNRKSWNVSALVTVAVIQFLRQRHAKVAPLGRLRRSI